MPRPSDPAAPPDEFSVEAIMFRIAGGDTAAVFALVEHHGHRVAGVVRRQLRACGYDAVAPEDLQSLVVDACLELVVVAPSWRPGAALPWWWAEGRIRTAVARWVGTHADPLADHHVASVRDDTAPAPTAEAPLTAAFAALVERDPTVRLVAEAARAARLDEAVLVCLLDYQIQHDQGDPSPAHTLAARYGVTPQTLRQRVSRGRRRLRQVVESDARFAALSGLELVA